MPAASRFKLVEPCAEALPQVTAAFARGWSPNNLEDMSRELFLLARDKPQEFLAQELGQSTTPMRLPDGSFVERLPGWSRWIFDDDFCGKISFRWRPPDETLPPTCLGHIGYAVVPWKRNAGAATAALRMLLPLIAPTGLRFVDVTTDAENVASIRVIERNGGIRTGEVRAPFAPDELRLLLRIQL